MEGRSRPGRRGGCRGQHYRDGLSHVRQRVRWSHNGGIDGFVVALSASLDALHYGTYLGGSLDDKAVALALRPGTSAAFVTGHTQSTNFPVTPGAFDTTPNGDSTCS